MSSFWGITFYINSTVLLGSTTKRCYSFKLKGSRTHSPSPAPFVSCQNWDGRKWVESHAAAECPQHLHPTLPPRGLRFSFAGGFFFKLWGRDSGTSLGSWTSFPCQGRRLKVCAAATFKEDGWCQGLHLLCRRLRAPQCIRRLPQVEMHVLVTKSGKASPDSQIQLHGLDDMEAGSTASTEPSSTSLR